MLQEPAHRIEGVFVAAPMKRYRVVLFDLNAFCSHSSLLLLLASQEMGNGIAFRLLSKPITGLIPTSTPLLLWLSPTSTKIVHRDLKASNILLDENMNPLR